MLKLLIGLLLLAAFAFTVIRWQSDQYKAFRDHAVKTQGIIIAKQTRTFRPNQQTGKENWVTYHYSADGKDYSGEEKIEYADLWHDLAEQQERDIYFTPGNPEQSHLAIVLDRRLQLAVKP